MKGEKSAKKGATRSKKQTLGVGNAGECVGGPQLSLVTGTIGETLRFGTERQRKVFPVQAVTMKKTDLLIDRIHIISNVLLPEECEYFISWGEERGFEEFKQAKTREYAHRENGRIQIEDVILAQRIYARVLPLLPTELDRMAPLGCSSNIRLYRYTAGQSFGKHIDEDHFDPQLNGITKYTLLVYLSGVSTELNVIANAAEESNIQVPPSVTCTGGETIFYKGHHDTKELLSVVPEAGKMVLHGHGPKCLTHEGSAVTSGVKYVLRTDVVYG
eukprot:gene11925-13832_t